eukprot:2475746-Alexandrium_andersonii.AAC.1
MPRLASAPSVREQTGQLGTASRTRLRRTCLVEGWRGINIHHLHDAQHSRIARRILCSGRLIRPSLDLQ